MLRNYLGDAAFFKGLTVYLTTNKFKNGEPQQLRLGGGRSQRPRPDWFFY